MLIDAMSELWKIKGHKWLSIEPLMEQLNGGECEGERLDGLKQAGIGWLVIGGWSRGKTQPKIEWVREIIEACDKAGIPVWLKDNLGYPKYTDAGSRPFYERWSDGVWSLRQERAR